MRTTKITLILLLLGMLMSASAAQKDGEAAASAAAQANNPLANMTAFNLQNYYIGDLTETDETANQFWLRYAQPFSVAGTDWLMRASLPVNTFPALPDGGKETGIGDLNVFAAYLIDVGNPAISFGIGPQFSAPTAGKDELGSGKCSAGFANILYSATSKVFQYVYLLTWQASFAGDSDRENVNIGAIQPFAFLQLGHGTYLRAAPIWNDNFENDTDNVPLGVGIGQVMKTGKTVFNVFVEP